MLGWLSILRVRWKVRLGCDCINAAPLYILCGLWGYNSAGQVVAESLALLYLQDLLSLDPLVRSVLTSGLGSRAQQMPLSESLFRMIPCLRRFSFLPIASGAANSIVWELVWDGTIQCLRSFSFVLDGKRTCSSGRYLSERKPLSSQYSRGSKKIPYHLFAPLWYYYNLRLCLWYYYDSLHISLLWLLENELCTIWFLCRENMSEVLFL
jgi:hypothetical protein